MLNVSLEEDRDEDGYKEEEEDTISTATTNKQYVYDGNMYRSVSVTSRDKQMIGSRDLSVCRHTSHSVVS